MKLNEKSLCLWAGEIVVAVAAALIICLSIGDVSAKGLESGQVGGEKRNDSLDGNWDLFVTLQGAEGQPPETAKVISFVEAGSKLSGKVTVPNVTPTGSSFQIQGARDLTLTDLKYNGKNLSFKVGDEDSYLIADLNKVGNDEFAGTWRSPIGGRWKGSKSEFSGALKLIRKKDSK